ncbi:MAG TPA: hypothetical protein VEX41_02790 [Candidatus Eisenbacteria bacterium]|nr:hypothetical protein [Candidatus Eisenbacteria bacterium]
MRKRRWPVRLGASLVVVAGSLAALRLQAGVDAGPKNVVPAPAACSVSPVGAGEEVTPQLGTWWKTVDRLDPTGTLVGRQVFVGRNGAAAAVADLAAESAVSGPVGGVVVATSDDGSQSEIRLLSVRDACSWVAYQTESVVRSAILDPKGGTLLLHLLDRTTRADRGIWKLSGAAGPDADPVLVAPSLGATDATGGTAAAIAAIGIVWSTELRLDARGSKLAVQSCGDGGCLIRVVELRNGSAEPLVVGGPAQGDLLGFAGDELVTWSRCPGLPCSVVSWNLLTGGGRILVDETRSAGLTGDGRRLVAVVASDPGSRALEVDPATGAGRPLAGFPPGVGPLPGGRAASSGLEVAADEIVIGSPARDPRAFRPGAPAEVVS